MDSLSVTLDDGRALGYREYGDPRGQPVVNCHGGLLCGLDIAPFHETAMALGVRIVSPDRPGLGNSDPAPGRTTGAWSGDVATLLDALEIPHTAVLGWSMGGQYALACAAHLPERITRAVVIAGAIPLDDDVAFAQLNAMDRRLTRLAQHHPHVARAIFAALGELATHTPDVWAHLTARGAVPDEAAAIDALPDPGIAAAAAGALAHTDGMVEEYRAWARSWGFAPEDIRVPTTIWQGEADDLVRPSWGRDLAARIPHARLVLLPGEGHFLGYLHQREILGNLSGVAPGN